MKKKPRKPPPTKALLSRQWQSESTVFARAAGEPREADFSPTDGPPPDPCENAGKPPANVPWVEQPTEFSAEPPGPGALGQAKWSIHPILEAAPFCDGKEKIWVGRVTAATGKQVVKTRGGDEAVTFAKIAAQTDCTILRAWFSAFYSAATVATDSLPKYIPEDVILAHEIVHVRLATAYTADLAATFQGEVDGLSAPCKDDDGEDRIKAGINRAQGHFEVEFKKREVRNADHVPSLPFLQAQYDAALPSMEAIVKAMKDRNCQPLPLIPPRPQ